MIDSELRTSLHAHITDNQSGETRVYHFHDEVGMLDFDWGENNNACDCNRSLHFSRAAGGDGWSEMVPCGMERYFVRILNDAGDVVYTDDEPSLQDSEV